MADGPKALTWKVPCALVVAADTIGWSATVDPVQFAGEKLANAGRTGMACGHKICKCCGWISGEVIVQTCTTESSDGDVVKEVSRARIKTWPGG